MKTALLLSDKEGKNPQIRNRKRVSGGKRSLKATAKSAALGDAVRDGPGGRVKEAKMRENGRATEDPREETMDNERGGGD